ncbi:MAG TPA: hypothetical protein VFN97_19460 [Actinospica sp.]|nr:hypothetical protein [Actinospica sp.]
MALSERRLFRLLEKLALPLGDYVVTGSAPLLAHGLKASIHDLDLVARGKAWEIAESMAPIVRSRSGFGHRIALEHGAIEVFDHWVGGLTDVDAIVENAEFVDGIPFMSLKDTMIWKRGLGRAKDLEDIRLIEAYLSVPAR